MRLIGADRPWPGMIARRSRAGLGTGPIVPAAVGRCGGVGSASGRPAVRPGHRDPDAEEIMKRPRFRPPWKKGRSRAYWMVDEGGASPFARVVLRSLPKKRPLMNTKGNPTINMTRVEGSGTALTWRLNVPKKFALPEGVVE